MTKTFIAWTGNALVALLLLFAAFILVTHGFLGWRFNTVVSGSMAPELKVGAIAMAQPVDPEAVAVGDVITYYSPQLDKLIVHRVAEKYEGNQLLFVTKGDANGTADAIAVPARNVVGKVTFHCPLLGYLFEFLRPPLTSIPLAALSALLLFGKQVAGICIWLSRKRGRPAWGAKRFLPPAPWTTPVQRKDWAPA